VIRWCAYCQTYMDEVAPFDNYALTHSICRDCLRRGVVRDPTHVAGIRPIVAYYDALRRAAGDGDVARAGELLDQGLGLGLRPTDLALGILQPLLHRIGTEWAAGRATVAEEHRFTAFCTAMIALLFDRRREMAHCRGSANPHALLVPADGNYHVLGTLFVEFCLMVSGVPNYAVVPGLPVTEVARLASTLNPAVIGISVAEISQLAPVRDLAMLARGWPPERRPRIVIGGPAIRLGLQPIPEWGIETAVDFRALLPAG
jgi:methanogenic corrinoid protein MtbC1